MKAWRKNPRRVLDIDPVVVTAPSQSLVRKSGSGNVAVCLKQSSTCRIIRFYNLGRGPSGAVSPGGVPYIYSEVGPPVYFGILLRSDFQVAAGHPLTDWWFDLSNTLAPGPVDRIGSTRNSGVGNHSRQAPTLSLSSTDAQINAEFDDYHNFIYGTLRTGTSSDSNTAGVQVDLTTDASFEGWACFWWWHPTEDWYWRVPAVFGRTDALHSMYHQDSTSVTAVWHSDQFRDAMNRIKTTIIPGAADQEVEFTDPGDLTTPITHRTPSILGRGPWVRISPGEVPDSGVRLADASCYVSRPHPEWP